MKNSEWDILQMNSLLEKMRRTWYSITTYEKLEMMHLEKSDKNDIDHPSAAAFALYDQHLLFLPCAQSYDFYFEQRKSKYADAGRPDLGSA